MDRATFRESVDRKFREAGVSGIEYEKLLDDVVEIGEVYADRHDGEVRIRATIEKITTPTDTKKGIQLATEVDNNAGNRIALAMLGGSVVDIIGVQMDIEAERRQERAAAGQLTVAEEDSQGDIERFLQTPESLLPDEQRRAELAGRVEHLDWWLRLGVAASAIDATSMGLVAAYEGAAREDNPFKSDAVGTDIRFEPWNRGWDEMATAMQRQKEREQNDACAGLEPLLPDLATSNALWELSDIEEWQFDERLPAKVVEVPADNARLQGMSQERCAAFMGAVAAYETFEVSENPFDHKEDVALFEAWAIAHAEMKALIDASAVVFGSSVTSEEGESGEGVDEQAGEDEAEVEQGVEEDEAEPELEEKPKRGRKAKAAA